VNIVTVAQLARIHDALAVAARAAGRAAPPLTAWVPAALTPGDAARAELARQLVLYVGQPGYGEMFIDAGYRDIVALARGGAHPRAVEAAITSELIDAVCLAGTRDELRDGLAAYAAAGADEIAIVPVTADDSGGAAVLQALAPT